ncbi:MAG TPA: hypothetical protein VGF75_00330 [Candidatus Saccharimonadales bacterium]
MQAIEAAMESDGVACIQFKKYTISVSEYTQGRKLSGIRVVWSKNK